MAKQITRSQLAGLLRQEGFEEDLIPTMIAISQAESGLNPRALNPDASTGDYSLGLFQINMLGKMGEERRRQFGLKANEELYDPRTNVRAAKAILDSQGLGAWSVTRGENPAYKQYLPGAIESTAKGVSSMPELTAPPPVDSKATDETPEKKNSEFLKSYIGGGLGATRALAPPAAPKSINVLGLLQSAFKAPELMD